MFGNGNKKNEPSQPGGTESAKEEEAREKAQKRGSASPEEALASLPSELQGSADRLAASGSTQDQIDELKRMIARQSDVIADLQANQKKVQTATGREGREMLRTKERPLCAHCEQYVELCGGRPEDHCTMRVLPEHYENFEGFPGVILNGKTYVGICVVPKVCTNIILGTIRNYEDYRVNLRHNRGKIHGLQRDIMLASTQKPGGYDVFGA